MQRRKPKDDSELSQAINAPSVDDRTAQQVGRVHSRATIEAIEDARVPWLRRRREQWQRQQQSSS